MPGWQTPYGTVTRPSGGRGDEAYLNYWRQRMGYQRPAPIAPGAPAPSMRPPPSMGGPAALAAMRTPEYREQWYPPDWQPSGIEFGPFGGPAARGALGGDPRRVEWYPSGRPTPEASWQATAPPTRFEGPVAPGVPTDVLPAWFTGAPGAPVTTPSSIAGGGSMSPYTVGMRPPALGVAPGLTPAFTPGAGAPTGAPAGAPPGAGSGAPTGALTGTPTATGAFGPFGSIEDWRNQFHAEHGRWPTEGDAQDAIASFGFLSQTGRSPSQQEWEDRWYGGYGGTTQWGPMGGGQYGYGGYGGWAPPPEPSWWGGNVFGDEGWAYLPTGAGTHPYPTPDRPEGIVSGQQDWYNIQDIKSFQEVTPQWRDWLQQAMQSQQQYWENPLMAPIQWMQPAQSEL